ncbi:uncharacterized protein [Dermacentor albipictus]|uniref:uncharacterized protein isoform X1 n=1 Tax=Dermacentor albipictus TaxID=60249 RepID=UPI0038FC86F9
MREQVSHVVLLVTFAWLGSAVAGPIEKPENSDKIGKQTVQEFFTSDWGACEPLKNPLVIPEMSDPQTWIRCQKHLPEHPSDIEEYLPRLSRCMLKSTGWVRSNGNMNLSKYLQYLSLLGLDNETMDSTREAHKGCISKAYKETDFKTQDKLYVECIFRHFTKVCGANFQGAVKEGYIVGITQLSFMPRMGPLEVVDEVDGDDVVETPPGEEPAPRPVNETSPVEP